MGKIIRLEDLKELRKFKSKEKLKKKFTEEVTPGSVVHIGLDRKIYWDLRTGKLAYEPDFPHNWPLDDFVGWFVLKQNLEIGPSLCPFANYLTNGESHSGIYFEFPWEHITGYKIHYKREFLFGDTEDDED